MTNVSAVSHFHGLARYMQWGLTEKRQNKCGYLDAHAESLT